MLHPEEIKALASYLYPLTHHKERNRVPIEDRMKIVVVGASSGLGRCIGVGLAQRGARVALLARRMERLESARAEAGPDALAIHCDVTDESSCAAAIRQAADRLGGLDALVYTPGMGPLERIEDVDAGTWGQLFATNVVGASIVTAAALPHLASSGGRAIYLSSVSASQTPPWPGLGAYVVSKAALERLVEAWRGEHPEIAFTRVVVGDCAGGEGHGGTEFAAGWHAGLVSEMAPLWIGRNYMTGDLLDVEDLVTAVDTVLRIGPATAIPTIMVVPRPAGR